MKNTTIPWTDYTFNPWIGCTKISPACQHCYAEIATPTRVARAEGRELWGKGKPRQRTSAATWKNPRKWNREAVKNGTRPRVFCASLADWLDDEVPIEWLADLLALIHATPNLDWLLLTKRPENWKISVQQTMDQCDFGSAETRYWVADWRNGKPPSNVWIGTTVENQKWAEERHVNLMAIPARVHFWSAEPLLSGIDARILWAQHGKPSWVIAGGESGPQARPSHPDWFRSLRDQCVAAGVAFHFKQWGEWMVEIDRDNDDPDWRADYTRSATGKFCILNLAGGSGFHGERVYLMKRVGTKAAGRLLDGVEHNGFPQVSAYYNEKHL